MKYSIEGLSNTEVIRNYFVRENDILVRYLDSRCDYFPKDYEDTIKKIMTDQVYSFLKTL